MEAQGTNSLPKGLLLMRDRISTGPNSPHLSSGQILSHHAMRLSAVTQIVCKGPSVLPNTFSGGMLPLCYKPNDASGGTSFFLLGKAQRVSSVFEAHKHRREGKEAGRGTLVMQTAAQHAGRSQGHQSSEKEYCPSMKTVQFSRAFLFVC